MDILPAGADAPTLSCPSNRGKSRHTVHYGYDASGNLTDVTDVGGGVTHFGYDASHRLTTVTDPRGHTVTTNVYDSSNRVTSQTDALNRTITWDYSTPGHTKITTRPAI